MYNLSIGPRDRDERSVRPWALQLQYLLLVLGVLAFLWNTLLNNVGIIGFPNASTNRAF